MYKDYLDSISKLKNCHILNNPEGIKRLQKKYGSVYGAGGIVLNPAF